AEAAIWIVERGNCSGIFHAIAEDDLRRILRHPATMIASDGGIPIFGKANPHPRNYGTFARILAAYVRELNIITLEDAVRKMSSLPAQRLGLTDRGLIRPGMKADIAVSIPRAYVTRPHRRKELLVEFFGDFPLILLSGAAWEHVRPWSNEQECRRTAASDDRMLNEILLQMAQPSAPRAFSSVGCGDIARSRIGIANTSSVA